MKIIIYILIATLLFVSCNDKNSQYIEVFQENRLTFDSIKERLETKYILNQKYNDRKRLIFRDCSSNNTYDVFYELTCDTVIENFSKKISIDQINLEKYYLCETNQSFNQITMKIQKNATDYHSAFYVYSYCLDTLNYKSETIESIYLDNGWSLYIEKN
ncbi:MAG: hypothetical protein IT234_03220 [Bacteroidia bacterium]|nr:hypothetical protein [Bacteroidia bacterium]